MPCVTSGRVRLQEFALSADIEEEREDCMNILIILAVFGFYLNLAVSSGF